MRRLSLVTEKGLICDGCGAELPTHGEAASCEPCESPTSRAEAPRTTTVGNGAPTTFGSPITAAPSEAAAAAHGGEERCEDTKRSLCMGLRRAGRLGLGNCRHATGGRPNIQFNIRHMAGLAERSAKRLTFAGSERGLGFSHFFRHCY